MVFGKIFANGCIFRLPRGAGGLSSPTLKHPVGFSCRAVIHTKHMNNLKLAVTTREGKGRGFSRRLRAQGSIPAVIYGKSGDRPLAVVEKDFTQLMREAAGSASVITIEDDKGKSTLALIQATQRNPTTDRFEHIDFLEVSADKAFVAHIPVHTHGEAYGVKLQSGILEVAVHEIEVLCLPKDLPEHIDIDITEMKVGDAVHLGDLKPIEGVTFHGDPETIIVTIVGQRVEEEPVATEEEAAPEGDGEADSKEEKAES